MFGIKRTANDTIKAMTAKLSKEVALHNNKCVELSQIIAESQTALAYHDTQRKTLSEAIEAANATLFKPFAPSLEQEIDFAVDDDLANLHGFETGEGVEPVEPAFTVLDIPTGNGNNEQIVIQKDKAFPVYMELLSPVWAMAQKDNYYKPAKPGFWAERENAVFNYLKDYCKRENIQATADEIKAVVLYYQSFPPVHIADEPAIKNKQIMEKACDELFLKYSRHSNESILKKLTIIAEQKAINMTQDELKEIMCYGRKGE